MKFILLYFPPTVSQINLKFISFHIYLLDEHVCKLISFTNAKWINWRCKIYYVTEIDKIYDEQKNVDAIYLNVWPTLLFYKIARCVSNRLLYYQKLILFFPIYEINFLVHKKAYFSSKQLWYFYCSKRSKFRSFKIFSFSLIPKCYNKSENYHLSLLN